MSDDEPVRPDRLQMVVFGGIAVAALLQLLGDDSGVQRWIDAALLVAGLVGFGLAVLRPSLFRRRR